MTERAAAAAAAAAQAARVVAGRNGGSLEAEMRCVEVRALSHWTQTQCRAGVGLESNLPACRCQCACAILKERLGLRALAQPVARATRYFSMYSRHEDNILFPKIRGVCLGRKMADRRRSRCCSPTASCNTCTSHQTNLSTPNVGDQSRVASRRRRKGARRTGDVQATQLYLSTVVGTVWIVDIACC